MGQIVVGIIDGKAQSGSVSSGNRTGQRVNHAGWRRKHRIEHLLVSGGCFFLTLVFPDILPDEKSSEKNQYHEDNSDADEFFDV